MLVAAPAALGLFASGRIAAPETTTTLIPGVPPRSLPAAVSNACFSLGGVEDKRREEKIIRRRIRPQGSYRFQYNPVCGTYHDSFSSRFSGDEISTSAAISLGSLLGENSSGLESADCSCCSVQRAHWLAKGAKLVNGMKNTYLRVVSDGKAYHRNHPSSESPRTNF